MAYVYYCPFSLSPSPPPYPTPSVLLPIQPLVFSNRKHNYVLGEKLPLWKKLTYAVGSMPYAMCVTVLGFYFSIFLLEVVIVSARKGLAYSALVLESLGMRVP